MKCFSPEAEIEKTPAIPEGHSTHDYVGGSTLLKKRSPVESQERSRRVDEMLKKYSPFS
jgi:hypothetical protein